VLIGLLVLISQVKCRHTVRAFLHTYAVVDSHSSDLVDWASQFVVSNIDHSTREHVSRISVG
jgi:hypothetical protein